MKDTTVLHSESGFNFASSADVFKAIFFGGLTVGILDGLFALVYYGLILGAPATRIFQSVAAGLLGKDSFAGGTPTFVLGILLHFVVAVCIASVYCGASVKLLFLIRHPVGCGLIYGMIAYLVMNYVVIPLSNAAAGQFSLLNFTVAFLAHALLVGLPIGLITRKFSSFGGKIK